MNQTRSALMPIPPSAAFAQDGDASANLSLTERDPMTTGGEPKMRKHRMSLNEGHDWAVYFAQTFNRTNQWFNPKNTPFLPQGQKFEEENAHLIYRCEGLRSLDVLEHLQETFKHPFAARWISAPTEAHAAR